MQLLNFQSFEKTIDICIQETVEFVIIAGDLFDSAYPPIEILKETFGQFRKLKEAKIPCYLIAGSHDYSVSGKTFLDVLEKAGFCKNVGNTETPNEEGKIILTPTIEKGVAIYGYPGKKSGLEIEELRNIKFDDAPGLFKILMLHTTIDKAKGSLPIDAIETSLLPKADYYALGHLHIDFRYENFVYPGPVFPNNFQELEDLKYGSFCIVNTNSTGLTKRIELKLKELEIFEIHVTDALLATSQIIAELDKRNIKDKIVLLRVHGEIEEGKQSDIKFLQIEEFAFQKGAYFLLKNTHDLNVKEVKLEFQVETKSEEGIEKETVTLYSEQNPSDFNELIPQLLHSLAIEKNEDEKTEIFNNRVLDEAKKILKF
jgi:DNA repair exonuclease SbcCD nuclease subunit